jgi:recombination DNA repair RAD52 pathway protein
MINPFTPEQIELLNKPLEKSEISYKEGNAYFPSHLAITRANKIFGAGNWGYHITSPFEMIDTGKTTKNGSIIYIISVQITLEVMGCKPITDIGDCEANGTTAPALSMARKGAVSDGVKRCLRVYGAAFGLELYEKELKPAQAQPAKPAANKPDQPAAQAQPKQPTKAQVLIAIQKAKTFEELENIQAVVDGLGLTADNPHLKEVNKAFNGRLTLLKKGIK